MVEPLFQPSDMDAAGAESYGARADDYSLRPVAGVFASGTGNRKQDRDHVGVHNFVWRFRVRDQPDRDLYKTQIRHWRTRWVFRRRLSTNTDSNLWSGQTTRANSASTYAEVDNCYSAHRRAVSAGGMHAGGLRPEFVGGLRKSSGATNSKRVLRHRQISHARGIRLPLLRDWAHKALFANRRFCPV